MKYMLNSALPSNTISDAHIMVQHGTLHSFFWLKKKQVIFGHTFTLKSYLYEKFINSYAYRHLKKLFEIKTKFYSNLSLHK